MDFLVSKDDLRETKLAEPEPIDVGPGEALIEVDRFGFTANNISYAVMGEGMNYWTFFPAPEGWGRIPVWGFGEVVASEENGLEVGEKVFGYLPMSKHMLVQPDRITETGFTDFSPHRAELPRAYNRYALEGDPGYDPEHEDEQMLLIPLFFTTFLADDFLDENDFFGAEQVVLGSASSRTALSLAWLLSRREGIDVIALTSKGNVEFVEGVGTYDTVLDYDSISDLPGGKTVYVDMSNNPGVRAEVHEHYGDDLAHSSMIGFTHWEEEQEEQELAGPRPQFFFAPAQAVTRSKDWGREEMQRRMREAWDPFVEHTADWLEIERSGGPEAVEKVYREVLEGESSPATGHVLSMNPD